MRDEKNASYVTKLRQYIDRLFDFAAKRGAVSHPPSPHSSIPGEVIIRVWSQPRGGHSESHPPLRSGPKSYNLARAASQGHPEITKSFIPIDSRVFTRKFKKYIYGALRYLLTFECVWHMRTTRSLIPLQMQLVNIKLSS